MFKNLTPAETAFLIDPSGSTSKELLGFTCFDLACKGVLALSLKKREGKKSLYYFHRGPNFRTYPFKLHEKNVVNIFRHNAQARMQLSQLLKHTVDKFELEVYYKFERIAKSPQVGPLLKHYFWNQKLKLLSLNKKGKERSILLADKTREVDERLLSQENVNTYFELIFPLGSNLFLLRNFELTHLKQIDPQLIQEALAKEKSLSDSPQSQNYNALFWQSILSWKRNENQSTRDAFNYFLKHFSDTFDQHAKPVSRTQYAAEKVVEGVIGLFIG